MRRRIGFLWIFLGAAVSLQAQGGKAMKAGVKEKDYEMVAPDEFGTVGLSAVMKRAEGVRMAKGKALSADMQALYCLLYTSDAADDVYQV
jgi:hypothetical protein